MFLWHTVFLSNQKKPIREVNQVFLENYLFGVLRIDAMNKTV